MQLLWIIPYNNLSCGTFPSNGQYDAITNTSNFFTSHSLTNVVLKFNILVIRVRFPNLLSSILYTISRLITYHYRCTEVSQFPKCTTATKYSTVIQWNLQQTVVTQITLGQTQKIPLKILQQYFWYHLNQLSHFL